MGGLLVRKRSGPPRGIEWCDELFERKNRKINVPPGVQPDHAHASMRNTACLEIDQHSYSLGSLTQCLEIELQIILADQSVRWVSGLFGADCKHLQPR